LIGIDQNVGFCLYAVVPDSMFYKVPAHLSSEHASFVEIYQIGFHSNKIAGVKEGYTIAIRGAGRVG
jgi:threonine dehydrogenase-like Zn-dependent dehydrogenase